MVATADGLLGVGLYSVAEAAFYARVPTVTMARWLYGSGKGARVLRPQLYDSEEKFVTFLDFVQALAIREVRLGYGASLQKIREGIERAQKTYKVDYPLARQHRMYLVGKELHIKLDDDDLVQVTGRYANQRRMVPVVAVYMKDIGFNAEGLASNYLAFQWQGRNISMDPQFRFGEPMLRTAGYSARALWEACKAEGGYEPAARAFGVAPDDVEAAFRYHNSLLLVNKKKAA